MSESPQSPTVVTTGEGAVRHKPGRWREETRDQTGGFLMTKNNLCLLSPLLNCMFLEGRSVADSSVSLPHPVEYFGIQ